MKIFNGLTCCIVVLVIFTIGGCGDESSSNSYREQVSSHTVQSVEDYKERINLRSEATKEVMEILSESIDLQELDKVVGEDPEFTKTFSGHNEEDESDTVPRTLGKVNSASAMSDLSQFSILDKIAFADNSGQLERVLKNSDVIGLKSLSVAGKSEAETLKERLNNVVERYKVHDNELKPDMGALESHVWRASDK